MTRPRTSYVRILPIVSATLLLVSARPAAGGERLEEPPALSGREDLPRERLRFRGCERQQRERGGYCLTTVGGQPSVLGLSSLSLCPIDTPLTFEADAFAWRGEVLYFCTGRLGGVVARASLVDGSIVELPDLPCSAVTSYLGGILVRGDSSSFLDHRGYLWFRDGDALLSGAPDAVHPTLVWDSGPIATGGTLMLSAWHSTDTLNVVDLRAQRLRDPIVLEGFDDWVRGLSVLGDGRIVVIGGGTGDRFLVFRRDGRLLDTAPVATHPALPFPLPGLAAGLSCLPDVARQVPRRLATIRPEWR